MWRPGAAACSNQLKPEEKSVPGAGMSQGPRGQGVQLAWNQELGSQALGRVRCLSGAAGVSPHLPPQTSSLSQGAHGRKRPSHPSSEKLFVCPASKLLCVLVPVPRREAGWPSQARCPPLVPAVRGQGWGWGGHGIAGSKQVTERAYGQVSHLLAIW